MVILVGVSRCGKTPTSLYLALQFGIRAANFPLTPDDFTDRRLPASVQPFRDKTAVISAIESIPVRQDFAMTGSLSVRGDVLPIGGVTYKIEAAAKAEIKTVLIPRMNVGDVLIEERYREVVTIIPVDDLEDVLKIALMPENREGFLKKLRKMAITTSEKLIDGSGFSPSAV